jgi:hypothetical protein
MRSGETSREQLQRLVEQIERLRRDAADWQAAGRRETAQELRTLASVLHGVVGMLERTERVLDDCRPRGSR